MARRLCAAPRPAPRGPRAARKPSRSGVGLIDVGWLIRGRVASRQGHRFTDLEAVRHMYRQFADAEIEPGHVITEPPAEPDTTAELIRARLTDGAFANPTTSRRDSWA